MTAALQTEAGVGECVDLFGRSTSPISPLSAFLSFTSQYPNPFKMVYSKNSIFLVTILQATIYAHFSRSVFITCYPDLQC